MKSGMNPWARAWGSDFVKSRSHLIKELTDLTCRVAVCESGRVYKKGLHCRAIDALMSRPSLRLVLETSRDIPVPVSNRRRAESYPSQLPRQQSPLSAYAASLP